MNATFELPESLLSGSQVSPGLLSSLQGKHKDITGLIAKNSPAIILIVPNSLLLDGGGSSSDSTTEPKIKPGSFAFTDRFLLVSLNEQRMERTQIMETFGEPAIFFFNERVRTYSISGTLIESDEQQTSAWNKNWADNFKYFYDTRLRGTILARNEQIAILSVNDHLIYGFPVSLVVDTNAANQFSVQFNLKFLVVKHNMSKVAAPDGISEFDIWKALGMEEFIKNYNKENEDLTKNKNLPVDDPNKENKIKDSRRKVDIAESILEKAYGIYTTELLPALINVYTSGTNEGRNVRTESVESIIAQAQQEYIALTGD